MSLKINTNCLKFSLPALLLLFWLNGIGQHYDFSGVDQLLDRNKKALGNELVALVYKDSTLVYKKEIGELFNAKTQAPIASCSKWLTAALVMTFVDQGKITLDEPLGRYLPVLEKYMKGYITLRHCLTHTTGIENEQTRLAKILTRKKFQTLEEEVNYLASREISNNPGKEFSYSNAGLNIAARVCEILGKKPFERLMQERITRPLKMRGTSFFTDDGSAPNPSGGGRSTANDYMNFLLMILHNGKFEGKQVLSAQSIAEMQKPQFTDVPVTYTPAVAQGFHYGLGEWIQEEDAAGNSTVVSSPGLFGTWPYVDKCRGYAAIVFVKTLLTEQKKDLIIQFKEEVDEQIGGCK